MENIAKKDPSVKNSPAISPEESAIGILKVIEESTRETHGGGFFAYDGSRLEF